jgi:hypothetical protein
MNSCRYHPESSGCTVFMLCVPSCCGDCCLSGLRLGRRMAHGHRLWMEMCEGWGAGCCCRGHHTIGRYLSAGDTIMTHVSLLHSGSPNLSNSKRYFFSVYYNISCERLCV